MDTQISEFMSGPVHTIGDDQPCAMARQRMQAHEVRHLVVLRGGHVVGILSDRDLALVEGVMPGQAAEVPVDEVMSTPPYVVAPEFAAASTLDHMAQQRLGAAVVVHQGKPVGIFTTTDAVRILAAKLGGA